MLGLSTPKPFLSVSLSTRLRHRKAVPRFVRRLVVLRVWIGRRRRGGQRGARILYWNCGGGFSVKLLAFLASCGEDADIIILLETHLPHGCAPPVVPGFSLWLFSREGAKRASGGIAVLVHERLAAHVQPWQPTNCRLAGPSPFHTWFRLDAAAGLLRPLLIGAVYLPPFKSKYGLRSRQQVEDFFAWLGDEVAEGMALPGGADVGMAGDWNAHLGCLQESDESSGRVMQLALGEEASEMLVPCASKCALPLPPRASLCAAPVQT